MTLALLERYWGLVDAKLEPLSDGINSETWLVRHGGLAYVAKQVAPAQLDDLVSGCEVAADLARSGLTTGAPVRTSDGRLLVHEHRLALLEHVPGAPLDGDTDDDQRLIGATLAAAHVAGGPPTIRPVSPFMGEWLAMDVTGHRWLVRLVAAVRAETDRLSVTWSTVHTDPAPEHFLHDPATGVTGIIDWAGARQGPVLYDLASAAMYVGGSARAGSLIDAYVAEAALAPGEIEHLDAFRRLREAIQGVYFARRLETDDLTGMTDRAENEKGLADARRRAADLGVG